jgi:hypothetical protein
LPGTFDTTAMALKIRKSCWLVDGVYGDLMRIQWDLTKQQMLIQW